MNRTKGLAKAKVLVVDDDKEFLEDLMDKLKSEPYGYEVIGAEDHPQALKQVSIHEPNVILLDLMFGRDNQIYKQIIADVHEQRPDIPIVLVTSHSSIEYVVESMRAGAYDFIPKQPIIDYKRLHRIIENAFEHHHLQQRNRYLQMENQRLREQLDYEYSEIIGDSPEIVEALNLVEKVANTDATVLILGESGTGKELVARAVHYTSPRADKPFVIVACGTTPKELLGSELFGHERGAFTGATARREGKFELADSGTIFLDEVGELDPESQVKLLRVLEEGEFERIGGEQVIRVDIRVIAATNRPLKQMVDNKTFREDLFYRLSQFTIELPTLQERGEEDIRLLTDHFVQTYRGKYRKQVEKCSPEAMKLLLEYHWPGNVRELANKVSKAVILAGDDEVELLPQYFPDIQGGGTPKIFIPPSVKDDMTLNELYKWVIIEQLKKCKGNVKETAKCLNIPRRTLYGHFNKYGIEPKDYRGTYA